MGDYKYKAFISYSHKDRKWTRWLHRRLETYPIPKNIIGNVTPAGTIPRRLKPIFRDREELSASNNLGEKIEAALASSKNLIIICSPAAAQSKWVNQEILTFKQNNRDAQLFSVIVEGEPYASTMPGREDEECFPPALRFEVNSDGTLSDTPAEPLAADLRPHADGKRLGFLKLISGMIGVGLDDVVQRDMKRSRNRVTAITTGSLATVLAMGTLTGFALDARSEAEQRRIKAEGLIEYMLTDLQSELQPVGRIDMLGGLTEEVFNYYNEDGLERLDCASSGRYARALHIASEIGFNSGDLEGANGSADKAFAITEKRLRDCAKRSDALIDHGVSLFYQSYGDSYDNDMIGYAEKTKKYETFVEEYCKLEPESDECKLNQAYVLIGLGVTEVRNEDGDKRLAIKYFKKAIENYESTEAFRQNKFLIKTYHADAHGWLASAYAKMGEYKEAINIRKKERLLYENLKAGRNNIFLDSETLLARKQIGADLGAGRAMIKADQGYEALALFTKMIPSAEALSQRDPKNEDWRSLKLWALIGQAIAYQILEKPTLSCQKFHDARKYQETARLPLSELELAMSRFDDPELLNCNKGTNP